MEAQDDVHFVSLVDTKDNGMLLRIKSKGRPSKQSTVNKNIGSSTYDEIKEALKLSGTPDILLAVAWMTNEELRYLQMFPEVWYVDVTSQTNNEKRQLLVLAGKDGMKRGFTGIRVFLPSEQRWIFDWFFNDCIIELLGVELIKRNKLIITDGDPHMYGPLRCAQVCTFIMFLLLRFMLDLYVICIMSFL